jgi:hypothetical protein
MNMYLQQNADGIIIFTPYTAYAIYFFLKYTYRQDLSLFWGLNNVYSEIMFRIRPRE